MPKKTKKQKILSRLHRLEQTFSKNSGAQNNIVTERKSESEPTPAKKAEFQQAQADFKAHTFDYSYVYKDIRKIIFLSVLALGVEILLSLTASTSYAKLVLRALNLE